MRRGEEGWKSRPLLSAGGVCRGSQRVYGESVSWVGLEVGALRYGADGAMEERRL